MCPSPALLYSLSKHIILTFIQKASSFVTKQLPDDSHSSLFLLSNRQPDPLFLVDFHKCKPQLKQLNILSEVAPPVFQP